MFVRPCYVEMEHRQIGLLLPAVEAYFAITLRRNTHKCSPIFLWLFEIFVAINRMGNSHDREALTPTECLFPRGFKLVSRIPLRHFVCVGRT